MAHRPFELTPRWQRELEEQRYCISRQQREIVDLKQLLAGKEARLLELEIELELRRTNVIE